MDQHPHPIVLTIAGSDSSGGAGIQADLKTFSALGTYGASVITSITAQNTMGVTAIHDIPAEIVTAQLHAIFSDLDVKAIKIGMVSTVEIINAIASYLKDVRDIPVILDPVMVSTTGANLITPSAQQVLRQKLTPLATLITPNMRETATLLNQEVASTEAERTNQAKQLLETGTKAVLVTGGDDPGSETVDIFAQEEIIVPLKATRVNTPNNHGTGCTLSAAVAANIAKGANTLEAVKRAKIYVTKALQEADQLMIGKGAGPVHHFFEFWADNKS